MMNERDTAAVETPDFLLAALERAHEAVVIVDRDPTELATQPAPVATVEPPAPAEPPPTLMTSKTCMMTSLGIAAKKRSVGILG